MASANLFDVVRQTLVDLRACDARCALVGGLAVGARALQRSTRDADFAISVNDDDEAEGVVRALSARGYRVQVILEQSDTNRLATVRLTSPLDGRTMVDILFASSGIEAEAVADAEDIDIGVGVICPVARTGHLVALKVLSRSPKRPQDDQDIGALLDGIDPVELSRARAAVRAIESRGCARGKDLSAELEAQVSLWTAP